MLFLFLVGQIESQDNDMTIGLTPRRLNRNPDLVEDLTLSPVDYMVKTRHRGRNPGPSAHKLKDLSRQIIASGDDYWVSGAVFDNTYNLITFGKASGNVYNSGVVFKNVNIIGGALIKSARIDMVAYQTLTSTVLGTVKGEYAANPVAPTSVADYNGRTRTSTVITWNPASWTAEQTHSTPDITAILTEIISHPNWVSGNSIHIFINDNGSADNCYRTPKSWDLSNTQAAKLVVTYFG